MRIQPHPRPTVRLSTCGFVGLICSLAVAVLCASSDTLPDPYSHRWSGRDHASYLQVAIDGPFTTSPQAPGPPFCYRVLVPWISHALATDHLAFFYAVSACAAALALTLLTMLFVRWGAGLSQALSVNGLLMLTGPWRDALHSYYVTDLPMLALAVMLLWLAELRQWVAFSGVLAVAILNREASIGLVAIPAVVLLFVDREAVLRTLVKTAAIAMAPALVLVATRVLIVPSSQYGLLAAIGSTSFPSTDYVLGITVRAFGVLLILAAAVPKAQLTAHLAKHPQLAVLGFLGVLQTLLGSDTQRLIMLAGPLVAWLAIEGLRTLRIVHVGWLLGLLLAQYALFLADFREPTLTSLIPYFRNVKAVAFAAVVGITGIVLVRAMIFGRPSEPAS